MAKISDIEGIGPALEKKLNAAGIKSVSGLLKNCCDKKGRKATAEATGIDEAKLLRFANYADLYRVKGIGSEYSELLEAAGVDTVKELRTRKAENLHSKMVEINTSKKLVRQTPSLSQVEGFIAHAKELDPVITH
jgi:predicted flap endonuclease-1-like 5' DNA nuclease